MRVSLILPLCLGVSCHLTALAQAPVPDARASAPAAVPAAATPRVAPAAVAPAAAVDAATSAAPQSAPVGAATTATSTNTAGPDAAAAAPGPAAAAPAATTAAAAAPVSDAKAAAPAPDAKAAAPAPDAAAADPAFDIMEYRIVGNSVLPTIAIERAVYPHLGEHRSMKDVEAARTALERVYQEKGFITVLVEIPEQKVDDGVVTLRVTEGRLRRVRVTGSRYYSLGRIRDIAQAAAPGTVPQVADLQRDLAALNRSADRRVTPVFKPGPSPGTVDMDLKVDDKAPLHGNVELNDLNSANTTPLRLSGSLRYDNLWQSDHSVSLQFQTAPQRLRDAKVLSATYVAPLTGSDNVLAFYAVHSRSDVGALGTLSVVGSGDIFGARGIVPLKAPSGMSHSLTFGIDHKHFGQSVNLIGGDKTESPISYWPLLAQYSATWLDSGGSTQFNGAINFALRNFMGSNRDAQFETKRANARPDYFFFKGDLQRQQNLGADWKLVARGAWQLASEPLIGNEQFSAGGNDTVRGYYEAEQLGDHALLGSLEVRSPYPAWVPHERIDDLYALAFVEAANLRLIEALPSQKASIGLASGGLGLRLTARKQIHAALDLAYALRDSTFTHAGDIRVRFKLGYEF